jgi:glyoxylase-like metal-dependent hydrolase (beta-lactamase superfamily II)
MRAMSIGDVSTVEGSDDVHYVDTGMYDTEGYGSVYVVDAEKPALVDSGIGTHYDRILDAMAEVGVAPEDLEYVLPTHVHLDHAGGAGHLLEACPNATVLCHEYGVRHLVDPGRLVEGTKAAVRDQWQYYTAPEPVPEERIEGLTDGDRVDLGDRELDVVHAPGHAPHQVTFHDDGDDLLFTGDAAGIYVPALDRVAVTSPPANFDVHECLADVRTIQDRSPERLCFGHFGDRAYERPVMDGYKRTLVEWVEAVRQRRERLGDDDAVVDHFVEHADEELCEVWGTEKTRAETSLNTRGVLGFLDSETA